MGRVLKNERAAAHLHNRGQLVLRHLHHDHSFHHLEHHAMSNVKHEDAAPYQFTTRPHKGISKREYEDGVIAAALDILRDRLAQPGQPIATSNEAKDFVRLQFAQEPSELFAVIMLDTPHRVIGCEVLYRGTIDTSAVYMRDMVRMLLERNAAAVIMVHNHPSGNVTPSDADLRLTDTVREYLTRLDIRLLDHLIVGGARGITDAPCDVCSLQELGYI